MKMKIDKAGVSFYYHGDFVTWLWFRGFLSRSFNKVFISLKELDMMWSDYWDKESKTLDEKNWSQKDEDIDYGDFIQ